MVESGSQGAARGYYSPQVRGAEPLTLASPVCLFEDEELGEDRGTSLNKEKKCTPGAKSGVKSDLPLLAGRQAESCSGFTLGDCVRVRLRVKVCERERGNAWD